METIISFLSLLLVTVYLTNKNARDKKELVHEITKSMLARNLSEYVETIPEDNEETEIEVEDELQPMEDVDEELLIKHLKEVHENI